MTKDHDAHPGLLRRIARRSLIVSGTVLTVALAVGLVAAGADFLTARAADTSEQAERAAKPVALAPLELQDSYTLSAQFTGPVEPVRSTDLGFEPGGTLSNILVDEGDLVSFGQVLAQLDTSALEADRAAIVAARAAAVAQRDIAQLTADRQEQLAARDFASTQRRDEAKFQLAVTEAEIARIDAQLNAVDVALAKSVIKAPYDGVITHRRADDGARLAPNQPILGLQDRNTLVRLGLPEALSEKVAAGDTLSVDLPSGTVTGEVERVRPDLDPATRTRGVLISLPQDISPVTGTLATVELDRPVQTAGAWVPMSALSEGVDGLWTIFAVPSGQTTLIRVAVTVEHVADGSAFVAGALPPGAQVVTAGTHRLSPGETVIAAGES